MSFVEKVLEWFGLVNNEDTSDFDDFGEENMDPDEDAPNLFIGKLIGSSRLEGKVISFDENNIQMQITKINDEYFKRYMDVGVTYPMFRHQHWTFEQGLMLWEIDPKFMKRDVSQILLQWEDEIGWTWDLDM